MKNEQNNNQNQNQNSQNSEAWRFESAGLRYFWQLCILSKRKNFVREGEVIWEKWRKGWARKTFP